MPSFRTRLLMQTPSAKPNDRMYAPIAWAALAIGLIATITGGFFAGVACWVAGALFAFCGIVKKRSMVACVVALLLSALLTTGAISAAGWGLGP